MLTVYDANIPLLPGRHAGVVAMLEEKQTTRLTRYSDFSTLKAKGLDVYDKHVIKLYILMEYIFFFFPQMKKYSDLMSLPPLPFIVIWSFM